MAARKKKGGTQSNKMTHMFAWKGGGLGARGKPFKYTSFQKDAYPNSVMLRCPPRNLARDEKQRDISA